MAIHPATLSNTPYAPGNPMVPPVAPVARPQIYYDWNTARCNTATVVQNDGTRQVNFTINPGGDTVFLPYGQGEIHSVFLPSAAGGPTCFMTAGMSGCKLFIDQVGGGNDLVVYHANAIGVGGGGLPMNVEAGGLTAALAAQHGAAQGYWTGPPHNHVLNQVAEFGRAVYNTSAVHEEARKTAQGRANAAFFGGTTVIGHLQGGQWRLYWQTYGSCTYVRPKKAPKGWFGNRTVGVNDLRHQVLGYGQIY